MSAAPLAAGAVLLAFAALWELAGERGEGAATTLRRALAGLGRGRAGAAESALRARIGLRIERAGLAGRLEPGAVLAAKALATVLGGGLAALAAPAAPGRLAIAVSAGIVAAGFIAPDALLERRARRRRERIVEALPDALDLLAFGSASGRSATALFGEIASGARGPLAAELAALGAEVGAGVRPVDALAALARRVPGAELAALGAALERSRVYGSPLADQLHVQAAALRAEGRCRLEERAARAAPKIQLVVALVLVPSILLTILAAIVAHSDALLGFAA